MKLIFIYGPAAAGKLTIARELAALTGLPVFHNHLIVDAVTAVFEFASQPFIDLRHAMWMAMFERATKEDRSLIFTFAPEPSVHANFVGDVIETVETRGGQVCFVELRLSNLEQERRIENASRAEFRKLRSLEVLRQIRTTEAPSTPMPTPDLIIDTESILPADAALLIRERFGL